jgi:DNA-binding PadR family transcriptional regulator
MELSSLGRFSEPALLIMVSLADGPKHGYLILNDIEKLTGERPGPGTLYGALSRLQSMELIDALPPVERRQPFELTDKGRSILGVWLAQLSNVAATGQQRLQAMGGTA